MTSRPGWVSCVMREPGGWTSERSSKPSSTSSCAPASARRSLERTDISGGAKLHLNQRPPLYAPVVLLDQMDVGGSVARNVAAVIHDLPDVPPNVVGLLGLSLFERFQVNLDLTSGVLILESGN